MTSEPYLKCVVLRPDRLEASWTCLGAGESRRSYIGTRRMIRVPAGKLAVEPIRLIRADCPGTSLDTSARIRCFTVYLPGSTPELDTVRLQCSEEDVLFGLFYAVAVAHKGRSEFTAEPVILEEF